MPATDSIRGEALSKSPYESAAELNEKFRLDMSDILVKVYDVESACEDLRRIACGGGVIGNLQVENGSSAILNLLVATEKILSGVSAIKSIMEENVRTGD